MEKYYITDFSKKVGVSTKTLRNWDKSGKLIANICPITKYRYYTEEHLKQLNLNLIIDKDFIIKELLGNINKKELIISKSVNEKTRKYIEELAGEYGVKIRYVE